MPGYTPCRAAFDGTCDSPVTPVPDPARAFPSTCAPRLTVRHVAVVDEASMFAGQPQPVEIHHRGIWYSGELIGWRHESNGRVSARVRCRVDGQRHSTWKDLADLRLPDPKHPPRSEPFPAVVRRPAPLTPEDEDDATRPHTLLAAMRGSRPAKPVHAVTPPPADRSPEVSRPPSPRVPVAEPIAERRRHQRPDRRSAYLSVV